MTKEMFESISEWQSLTFPHSDPLSKLAHLEEEVDELRDELVNNRRIIKDGYTFLQDIKIESEFADCFILLFGAAASYGMSYEYICMVIKDKMEINKNRKWGVPDNNGVVNHIK